MCGVIVCFRLANLFYSSIDIMPELKLAKRKTASLVSDLVRPFVLPFVCLSVRPPARLSVCLCVCTTLMICLSVLTLA